MLKNDNNINREKITSLILEVKTNERLLKGKKPPEEINVIDKLNESNVRKSKIFKVRNIKNVNAE